MSDYGTIDDVDFQEGEYFIFKNISGVIVEEQMEVDEEQTFRLLTRSIELRDDFTRNGSATDGIAWKDFSLDGKIINPDDNIDVECWDWQDDGLWDDCFADTLTDMNNCRATSSYLNSICNSCGGDEEQDCEPTDCGGVDNIYIGAVQDQHPIKEDVQDTTDENPVTNRILTSDVDAHYYYNCAGGNERIRGFGEPIYYVVDAKQAVCTGVTSYRLEGRYRNTPSFVTYNSGLTCGSGTECNDTIDEQLVFSKDANTPDVCGAISSTDIAILQVIPIQVIPDVDMVKDKSGFVIVVVENRGNVTGTAKVNVTFNGDLLAVVAGESDTVTITVSKNASINFSFKPSTAGAGLEVKAMVEVS